jgi:hypothetical protein
MVEEEAPVRAASYSASTGATLDADFPDDIPF